MDGDRGLPLDTRGIFIHDILTGSKTIPRSTWTPCGRLICEIKAGRGGEGTGTGATLTARDETFFCAACMLDNAVCEIECDRSCE